MKKKMKDLYQKNKKVVLGVAAFTATAAAIVVAGYVVDQQRVEALEYDVDYDPEEDFTGGMFDEVDTVDYSKEDEA